MVLCRNCFCDQGMSFICFFHIFSVFWCLLACSLKMCITRDPVCMRYKGWRNYPRLNFLTMNNVFTFMWILLLRFIQKILLKTQNEDITIRPTYFPFILSKDYPMAVVILPGRRLTTSNVPEETSFL